MLDFGVLGPLAVRHGGNAVPVGGTRQRAVLALLLVHANETLSVDRMVGEIWGPSPPATATKILRNSVSQLRSLFDEELVVTHPGGYELRIDPDRVDASRFERLVREGRHALAAGQAELGAAKLREGLALWRGPALGDLLDAPFAAAENARLEQLRLTAIEDRVDADLAVGRHAELVGELEALTAQYPLRERLRAQLMLALYRSGRQAEALEAYQRTRRLLVEELGIEPGRELQRLERAILVQDSTLELDVPSAPPEAAPAPDAVRAPHEVRKTVSVVVAEIVALGPQRDPEALRRPLARSREVVSHVLERHGGSVDQLITRAVAAVFGVPAVHEDDSLRAVRAAVEVRDAVAALSDELEREWGIRVAARSGVATGEVVVADGDVGHDVVAGDAAERAARLQQAAAAGRILIGDRTKRNVDGSVRVEPVELPPLDESSQPVPAWNLLEVVPGAVPIVRHPDAPMVGREQELAQLAQAFDRAVRERRSYLFTVLGPAGIGKSRLATEFAGSIASQATVLTGRCPPYGEAVAFWPLAEIVRQLVDDDESAIAALVAAEDDAALIAERIGSAIGLVEEEISTDEIFWAARKLFEAVARERPLVLVFEDVHWAEPTLLELVEHVAEYARDAPMLLVCLARPELLETSPSWAGGKLNATTILLDPLTDSESAQFLENLVEASPIRADALARIKEIAEGNPLFLEQMLAMLSEHADADAVLAVPPTIKAVLAARLDRLDAEERAVLECASVVGKEFWRTAVAELSPEHTRSSIAVHLDALVRRDLIWPHRSLFAGDAAFRFRHILLREVAYESVPKERRAELHETFAGWLGRAAGARAREFEEAVGHHLEQAHRYLTELEPPGEHARSLARRAAAHLAAGGRRAYARGDLPAARGLLSRAAALLEPGAPGQVELLIDLGDALRESGDLAAAEAVLTQAAAAVPSSADGALAAHVGIARLRLQLQIDSDIRTEEVLRAAKRAARAFERDGDERRLAKAWELLAWVPWFRCQAAAAEAAWLRALEYARRAHDSRTEAQSLNMLVGAVWFGPTPVQEGIRRYEEILARPAEQRRIQASVLRALAGLRAMEGEFDEARRAMADCRATLEDLGLRVTLASTAETAGIIELLAGDPVAAERELLLGYERLEEMGDTTVTPVLAALLAQALYAQERIDEALSFTELSEGAAAADDLSAHVQWRAARAKVLARLGQTAEAEALARNAVALAERTDFLVVHADALVDLAHVLRFAGRAEEAIPALRDALGLYERKGNVVAARRALASITDEGAVPPLHADR